MKELFNYYRKLLVKYQDEKDNEKKSDYVVDIYLLYLVLNETFENNFDNKYKSESKLPYNMNVKDSEQQFIEFINKDCYEMQKEFEKSLNKFDKFDLDYLDYLIKSIKLPHNNKPEDTELRRVIDKFSNTSYRTFINYIRQSRKFYEYYNNIKGNIIFDKNFIENQFITLKSDNGFILMKDNNNSYKIHELAHSYTKSIYVKYLETPSILVETAFLSNNNISPNKCRIDNLIDAKRRFRYRYVYDYAEFKQKVEIFLNEYTYYIGTLLAYAIIDKYGDHLEEIINIVDIIQKNQNLDLQSLLKVLDIKDNNIVDSTNKRMVLYK